MHLDAQTCLFWIVAGLTGLSAVSVVVTQNIVRAAAWLLFSLAGTAGLFFLLGADFVGATQLIVYVGGTLVLVVFGVMLTAQGPFISMKTGVAEWAIASLVGLLFLGVLVVSIATTVLPPTQASPTVTPAESMNSVALGESLLGVVRATPEAHITGLPTSATPLARTQMSYLLPFEIVSVHLLVVLIAAAYLARQAPPWSRVMNLFAAAEGATSGVAVGLNHYLFIGAVLFVCGAVCMATKRNAIGVLMGVELVLNGASVNFVAFARFNEAFQVEGQVFALSVIVLAAAEAAVALAIVLNFYNNHETVDVDTAEELKG